MSGIWHDYSREAELKPLAPVVGAVVDCADSLGIEVLVAGAFARDLLMHYRAGIPIGRRTDDLDFGISVADWGQVSALTDALVADRSFARSNSSHRLSHPDGHRIDIVPFGDVETQDRRIAWPPAGANVMDVFGFREALRSAHRVRFASGVETKLVTLPALVLLKLAAWQDRHRRVPRKDAADLFLVMLNYLDAGNRNRLFDDFAEWTEDPGFDYERAGARLLGHDVGALLDSSGYARIEGLLLDQCDEDQPGVLPAEMKSDGQSKARSMLQSLLQGVQESHQGRRQGTGRR